MTKKELQIRENTKVESLYEEFNQHFKPRDDRTVVERLHHCTAFVYTDQNGYIGLRSYNTFVAFITPDGDFVDVLRLVYGYTATSNQHIRKFWQDHARRVRQEYTYYKV